MDNGAWQAVVYSVAQSWTWPKRLSSSSSNSACKLNKQSDNIQPWCTPFLIWNQCVVPCPVLAVAFWPAYRFWGRQVKWSGIPISLRIFRSFLWSTQSKALALSMKQKYMFIWNSLAFSMIQWMLARCPLVPLPFLNPGWTSAWEMNTTVWWFEHSLVLPFLGTGMRELTSFSPVPRLGLADLLTYWVQHLRASSFRLWIALLEFHCIH